MKNETALLSLGSNMGDSLDNLLNAVIFLNEIEIRPCAVSSIYRTEAVGYTRQPDFLNMVVEAETPLNPPDMLDACLAVESQLNRVRTIRWGPRTIDIDILFYGKQHINSERLQIPHPRLKERAFVLIPLKEIKPEVYADQKVDIPRQKVDLLISSDDVKMKLHQKGLTVDKR